MAKKRFWNVRNSDLRRFSRNKSERNRVQTVALAGRSRAIGEDVAEVTIATRTANFGTNHTVAIIDNIRDVFGIVRGEETRPARARFELRVRAKQWQIAQPTVINAHFFLLQQPAAKRRLGALVQQHATLFGRKPLRQQ